jgi:uncharacterized membrane protein (UPF0127 family)
VSLRLAAALAAAGVLAACGAAPKTSPSPTRPPAPAADAGPRIRMPSGADYTIELALSPEQQEQGLMFRESLPEKTGMLFVFPETAPHHFWMKNTMIPLDMIWMDKTGKVLFIAADTPPCKADPCKTYGPDFPAKSVLEIAGGMAKREGVTVGAKLTAVGLK